MTIFALGSVNLSALVVPGNYVAIVPPQITYINGVPTGFLGVVGSASFGPVNAPTVHGGYSEYAGIFGNLVNRRYDIGTVVAIATQLGCTNFMSVRVTDGTDLAATGVITVSSVTGITFTGKYTGSGLNGATCLLYVGTAAATAKLVVQSALLSTPEVYDNIPIVSGNAFWVSLAAAVNYGNASRGASKLLVATAGSATAAAVLTGTGVTMAGGYDGATTITTAILLGADGVVRTGMYALRSSGVSVAVLADCADSTSWATQVTFGLSEQIYMVDSGPSGDSLSTAPGVKTTAGIDSYAIKILFGDWVYWYDTTNRIIRLVSPASFSAGLLANLSPEQSSLNKQMTNIVGTQKTYANQVYSAADLAVLANAGIDVITNPCPGGAYFGPVIGRNSSSNAVIHGDNYTRLTNFIASTINAWMGQVVGLLQNATTRNQAFCLLDQFFYDLWQQGIIGNADGTQPYAVTLNDTNNPPSRVALGYMQANVQVQYQSIVEYMITEIEGGQSVQITRAAVAPSSTN